MADPTKTTDAQNLELVQPAPGHAPPSLSIDWTLYASYLDELDATDEEKQAFVECLFTIVLGFVDLGFKLHPLQQTDIGNEVSRSNTPNGACGQNQELRQFIVQHMVESESLQEGKAPNEQ